MSFSSHLNNPDDIPSDESSVPDTPMSHLMFYFYCVDKLTNLSENNVQLRRVVDYKNDNLTPNELEILLVFCTQLDPDSLEGKCLIKNEELCGDKNFKVYKIEELPEGTVKSEDFFIAGQRVKCERVIAYKKKWIKTHFYEPWMNVIVPDKQAERKIEDNTDAENHILLPSQSPTPIKEPNNNNASKVVIIEGNKVRVEESNKVRINQNGSKVIVSNEINNNNNNNNNNNPAAVNNNDNAIMLPPSPTPTPEQQEQRKEEVKEEEKPKPEIVNKPNNNKMNEKPPIRVRSTPNAQPSSLYYPPGPPAPVENENKPISKHFTVPTNNNNITPSLLLLQQQQQYKPSSQAVEPHNLRQTTHTTKVDTNSNDVHIVINSKPPQNQQQKPKMLSKTKKVYKYIWCCCCEISKCLTCCIDCIRNILTFIILLVFIALLSMKFVNYMDYSSSLLQKYAIIAMFSIFSLSLECLEICINCCTVKSLNYMGYRLYSIFIAIYYILICIYTGIADSSLPFYCFILMAIIHLFGSCWKVSIEDEN